MRKVLLVIDVQNDYFADANGAFPLWNTGPTLEVITAAIGRARAAAIPVVHVQHVATGPSPLFVAGTPGVAIHPRVLAAAPEAPVVRKAQADAFHGTTLAETLRGLEASALLVAGMMTQNCVTHTAISKSADAFDVTVLGDACTTVSEPIHRFALHALSARVKVTTTTEAI